MNALRESVVSALAALSLPVLALAQCGVKPLFTAKSWANCEAMAPRMNGLAVAGDGTTWALVRSCRKGRSRLLLARVDGEGGAHVEAGDAITVAGDTEGSLIADPGKRMLHVAWTEVDRAGKKRGTYRGFDVEQKRWVTEPEVIVEDCDAYVVGDLGVTSDGTLVACVRAAFEAPVCAEWSGAWSSSLVVRGKNGKWSTPKPISTRVSSGCAELVIVDSVAHVFFIDLEPVLWYRAFDVSTTSWKTRAPIAVCESDRARWPALCVSATADADGNLYCMWARGGMTPGTGQIEIAYLDAQAADEFQLTTIKQDPQLCGLKAAMHFGVARGPGPQVLAFYSRKSDAYDRLYVRALIGGDVVGPEREVSGLARARSHQRVQALRAGRTNGAAFALTSGYPRGGEVVLVGAGAR